MKVTPQAFDLLVDGYNHLDPYQKAKFIARVSGAAPEEKPKLLTTVEEHLKERTSVQRCPRCGSSRIVKNGTSRGKRQRYLCRDCRKTVGLARGTIYFASKKPLLTWTIFMDSMTARLSLRECAKRCGISVPTAVAWRRKCLRGIIDMVKVALEDKAKNGQFGDKVDMDAAFRIVETELAKWFHGQKRRGRKRFIIPRDSMVFPNGVRRRVPQLRDHPHFS